MGMSKQKTTTGAIRLPHESWRKLRALFQYYGANNHVKTLWFQAWIDKQYAKALKNKAKAEALEVQAWTFLKKQGRPYFAYLLNPMEIQ